MDGPRSLAVLLAVSLLSSVFLAGVQAQNNTTQEESYEADDGGTEAWVDCWDDEHTAGCEAMAASREEAYDLLEEAEADGRTPFSLDDPDVSCQEDTWDDGASVYCHRENTQEQSWVECWEDREGPTCEAVASTREEARAALEEAEADGRVPFELDDPNTDCHTEEREDEVRLVCIHLDSLVECWEDEEGAVCEAWGETIEEARAKFDQEAEELPFDIDDPDVRCEEERGEREAILFCFEEHETEPASEPDEHRDAREGPGGEPECTPRPEEGVVECSPPPACRGELGETPQCQPPPECEIVDSNTVTCPMRGGSASASAGPQPDCEPVASDPHAMRCTPPSECEGEIGETAACTPPPECEPQGDGTFLCKLEDHRDPDAGPASREEAPGPSASEELDEELRKAVREALAGFREELETLRTEYEEGKAALAERYEDIKDELRAEYRACLDELGDDAERVEVLEKELACKKKARQALQEEREVLLAERDLLREDLLSKAQSKQFHTCQNLQETLHGILMDHGIFDSDLGAYLGPKDLGLCAGILLDAEVDGADVGNWGGEAR